MLILSTSVEGWYSTEVTKEGNMDCMNCNVVQVCSICLKELCYKDENDICNIEYRGKPDKIKCLSCADSEVNSARQTGYNGS